MRIVSPLALFALVITGSLACGGGGGGSDNSQVLLRGSLDDGVVSTARAISEVQTCALGVCDTTDASGAFELGIDDDIFPGGDVAFSFLGNGLDTTAVVSNLSRNANEIFIQFSVVDGAVLPAVVVEDGNVQGIQTPSPTATPDDGPLDSACDILRATNIAIPNSVQTLSHSLSSSSCPNEIDTVIAVGNPRRVAFSYQVTIDSPDVTIEPIVGTLQPGELARHDAAFLCSTEESFASQITASITMLMPEGQAPISPEQAVLDCGRDSAVGNLTESVPFAVTILP